MDTRLHIVDSLDKTNAPTQPTQPSMPRTMYIVYVVFICVVSCLALALFAFGYYEISRLAQTSIGYEQGFFLSLSYLIVILAAVLPLSLLGMVVWAIRSWIRKNNVVSGLHIPLHLNMLESDKYSQILIEGAVAATIKRMEHSKYSGVSTVSEGNNYSRTSNETTNTSQVPESTQPQETYSDEVAINSIINDIL